MIYPYSRWWFGTKGVENYRESMLLNKRLAEVSVFNEREVQEVLFPKIELAGGASIVHYSRSKNDGFDFVSTTDTTIVQHSTSVQPSSPSMIEDCRRIVERMGELELESMFGKIALNGLGLTGGKLQALNPAPYDGGEISNDRILYYGTVGGSKGDKSGYYTLDTPNGFKPRYEGYKVCFSQMILENNQRNFNVYKLGEKVMFGRSTVMLFESESQEEQENFFNYANTQFFESLIRSTLASRTKYLGWFVPDLGDYSNNNPLFAKDCDLPHNHSYIGLTLEERLAKLFELD